MKLNDRQREAGKIMHLNKFLVNAKKKGWAGGGKYKILEDGGREFTHEDGGFKYRDKYYIEYYGFSGQEIVWDDILRPVWSLNYYGKVTGLVVPKFIYAFLKKALMQLDEEKPRRGPELFKENRFKYVNEKIIDHRDDFYGREEIFHIHPPCEVDDEPLELSIYFGYYHGGLIECHEVDA